MAGGDGPPYWGGDDTGKNWRMLRAVLHVLRDRLPVAQCAPLSAQLPLILRGLYFEGRNPSQQPTPLRREDEFVQAVTEELSGHPEIDPRQAIDDMFRLLNQQMTAGEVAKVRQALPAELQPLWPAF